jgi:signal transduction histidine kinase
MDKLLSKAARRLRAQSPQILQRWEAFVLEEVPAASTVDREVLRDHLHLLLEQVVTALSEGAPRKPSRKHTTSEQHGGERALLEGYSLAEVLQEYSILRRMVLAVLDEGSPMSYEDRQIINDVLEQALIGASTQFALVQLQEEQALTEEAQADAAALLRADQHKNDFLAWLAHELRTPLGAITHALYHLNSLELVDDRATRQIAVATRQTRHLSRLVEDLLDFSRISRGALELRQERVDLRQPLMDAVEASKPLLDERSHQFGCALPQEPLWVEGDAVRLVQVFTNLLANAARYTPEGGDVGLFLTREGEHAVVRVTDTGSGIEPSMLARIFEPFVQLDSGRPEARQGLGIGLALLRRLVEMHGGTATAHSAGMQQGAEFVVRLPLLTGT